MAVRETWHFHWGLQMRAVNASTSIGCCKWTAKNNICLHKGHFSRSLFFTALFSVTQGLMSDKNKSQWQKWTRDMATKTKVLRCRNRRAPQVVVGWQVGGGDTHGGDKSEGGHFPGGYILTCDLTSDGVVTSRRLHEQPMVWFSQGSVCPNTSYLAPFSKAVKTELKDTVHFAREQTHSLYPFKQWNLRELDFLRLTPETALDGEESHQP